MQSTSKVDHIDEIEYAPDELFGEMASQTTTSANNGMGFDFNCNGEPNASITTNLSGVMGLSDGDA